MVRHPFVTTVPPPSPLTMPLFLLPPSPLPPPMATSAYPNDMMPPPPNLPATPSFFPPTRRRSSCNSNSSRASSSAIVGALSGVGAALTEERGTTSTMDPPRPNLPLPIHRRFLISAGVEREVGSLPLHHGGSTASSSDKPLSQGLSSRQRWRPCRRSPGRCLR